MMHRKSALALGALAALIVAAPLPAENVAWRETSEAPAGTPDTRYCMRIEAATGSLVERTKCWTREQWAAQGVDVDRDWPKNGVRAIG